MLKRREDKRREEKRLTNIPPGATNLEIEFQYMILNVKRLFEMRILIHMESVLHKVSFGVTIEVLFLLKPLVTMALNVCNRKCSHSYAPFISFLVPIHQRRACPKIPKPPESYTNAALIKPNSNIM